MEECVEVRNGIARFYFVSRIHVRSPRRGKDVYLNNIKCEGVVHDTVHGVKVALPAAPARHAEEYQYYSSNPLSFSFLPRSFTGRVNDRTPDWDSQGATVNDEIQYSEDTHEDIDTRLNFQRPKLCWK